MSYLQLIEAAYANPDQAKYMNKEKIEPYRGTGGVSNHYYRGTGGRDKRKSRLFWPNIAAPRQAKLGKIAAKSRRKFR